MAQAVIFLLTFGIIARGALGLVGGHDAPNHGYPYQVSFRHYDGKHFCSGSILNKRWILTAGHCFDGRNLKSFAIVTGTNFLNETGTINWPDFYVVHEEYRTYYKNNIALVRVIQDFVFTDSVKPITLPNENLQNYSMPAVTTGWGMTRMGSPLPNALQELDVNVLTVKQCEHPHNQVDDREICTLNKFGEGVCYGDDGGPLVINGLQVGIISYFGACAINSPDVYTRVWAYNTWINKTLARCPST